MIYYGNVLNVSLHVLKTGVDFSVELCTCHYISFCEWNHLCQYHESSCLPHINICSPNIHHQAKVK